MDGDEAERMAALRWRTTCAVKTPFDDFDVAATGKTRVAGINLNSNLTTIRFIQCTAEPVNPALLGSRELIPPRFR